MGQFRDVRSVAWGPQGIVFANVAKSVIALFVVSPEGGAVSQLAPAMRRPNVLPNGWILAGGSDDNGGITLLRPTEQPRPLIAGVDPLGYAAGHVLYNRQDKLVAHQFDERNGVLVGDPVTVGEAASDRVFGTDMLLTWVAGDEGLSGPLAWIDRLGRRTPVPGSARPIGGATIAVHDDLLLATSMRPPGPRGSDLWTMRLDTGALTRVFEGPDSWDGHPRWSRDGARLLFRSSASLKRVEVGRAAPPDTVGPSLPGLERLDDWSADERHAVTRYAIEAGAAPVVRLSHAVVEAGLYDAPASAALVLANFTYQPIAALQVDVPLRAAPVEVQSLEHGSLKFTADPAPPPWREEGYTHLAHFSVPLAFDDLIVVHLR